MRKSIPAFVAILTLASTAGWSSDKLPFTCRDLVTDSDLRVATGLLTGKVFVIDSPTPAKDPMGCYVHVVQGTASGEVTFGVTHHSVWKENRKNAAQNSDVKSIDHVGSQAFALYEKKDPHGFIELYVMSKKHRYILTLNKVNRPSGAADTPDQSTQIAATLANAIDSHLSR